MRYTAPFSRIKVSHCGYNCYIKGYLEVEFLVDNVEAASRLCKINILSSGALDLSVTLIEDDDKMLFMGRITKLHPWYDFVYNKIYESIIHGCTQLYMLMIENADDSKILN